MDIDQPTTDLTDGLGDFGMNFKRSNVILYSQLHVKLFTGALV